MMLPQTAQPTEKLRVTITSRVFPSILALFDGRFQLDANPSQSPWSANEWLQLLHSADAVIAFMPDRIGEDALAQCPRLKLISCALKGYDNFDVEACARRGIAVCVVEDLLTAPTAELAIGLLIAVSRNLLRGDALVRSGEFSGWRPVLYGFGIRGSTVGLLGMGAIGQATATRLKAFDCTVLYHDQNRLPEERERALGTVWVRREDLLAHSDFVILALPLSAETVHYVDRNALERLKPGAFLINPARGSLVDESAVADALASGRLGGYAADVFELEDWARPDRPQEIAERLRTMTDRTVFTPHLGSAVASVRRAIEFQAAQNVIDFFSGKAPRGLVTSKSGGRAKP
jgi:phosphonate dehydrogenase